MEIIKQTKPKARKEYKCDWCGLTINKGEKYESSTLKSEGQLCNWRNHIKCNDIAKKLDMFEICNQEGLSQDDFREIISEKYAEIKNIQDYSGLPDFKIQLDAVCEKYLSNIK